MTHPFNFPRSDTYSVNNIFGSISNHVDSIIKTLLKPDDENQADATIVGQLINYFAAHHAKGKKCGIRGDIALLIASDTQHPLKHHHLAQKGGTA